MARFHFLALAVLLTLANGAAAAAAPNTSATNTAWSVSLAYEARGDYASAIKALDVLLRVSQPDDYALLRYGWLNYLAGNHNESLTAYERALKANPASLDARLGISLPLMAQQRWNKAEEVLRQMLREDPWNYTAHTRLMQVEEAGEQWENLARHARDFQRRYPSDATTLVYLARASLALQKESAARDAYLRVLHRYPANEEANTWLKYHP